MSDPVCLIKCLNCHEFFRSPIQFPSAESFYTSFLAGNQTQCKKCRHVTRCDKENMYFNPGDGSVHTGEDTIPKPP